MKWQFSLGLERIFPSFSSALDVVIPISFRSHCFTEIQLINCDRLGFKHSIGFAFFGIQRILSEMVSRYPGLCKRRNNSEGLKIPNNVYLDWSYIYVPLSGIRWTFPAEVLSEIFTMCLEENSSPWRWEQMFLWEKHTSICGLWTDSGVLNPFPVSILIIVIIWLTKVWHNHWKKTQGLHLYEVTFISGSSLHCATLSALHWVS